MSHFFSPQWMLLVGMLLSLLIQGNALQAKAKNISAKLLQISIVLLGASLNFNAVLNQGGSGILTTLVSILLVFFLGFLTQKMFRVENEQATLITMGTAICGGSAIGALAPVIKAQNFSITVAIGVVFILNALAIFIYPPVGTTLGLNQEQFGIWSALAIHDTSSVVAASSLYGEEALSTATTLKLIRALWIIPITLVFSFLQKDQKAGKMTIPWFILGFVISSLIFTFAGIPESITANVSELAKVGFTITLFLIGLTFDFKKIRQVGLRPLFMGSLLWIVVSTLSLMFVIYFH